MAEELVGFAFWLSGQFRRHPRTVLRFPGAMLRQRSFREATYLAGLWIAYVLGALVGAVSLHALGMISMMVPVPKPFATVGRR